MTWTGPLYCKFIYYIYIYIEHIEYIIYPSCVCARTGYIYYIIQKSERWQWAALKNEDWKGWQLKWNNKSDVLTLLPKGHILDTMDWVIFLTAQEQHTKKSATFVQQILLSMNLGRWFTVVSLELQPLPLGGIEKDELLSYAMFSR
jgi:hypothetical protein